MTEREIEGNKKKKKKQNKTEADFSNVHTLAITWIRVIR